LGDWVGVFVVANSATIKSMNNANQFFDRINAAPAERSVVFTKDHSGARTVGQSLLVGFAMVAAIGGLFFEAAVLVLVALLSQIPDTGCVA
jgi:hypothetical protein